MRITLLQTPWSKITAGPFGQFQTKFVFYPPSGLLYLAAFLESHGHQVTVIDLEAEPLSLKDLCVRISESELIGLTASTPVFHVARAYASALKKRLALPIVVGGAHVSALKEESLTDEFDFAIPYEGEQSGVNAFFS